MKAKNNKEIAIVTTFYSSRGGVSTYVKNIYNYSQKSSVKIKLFTPNLSERDATENIIKLRGKTKLIIVFETIINLYNNRIAFIQCHGAWYLLLGCIIYKNIMILKNKRVRVIAIKHSDAFPLRKLYRKIQKCLDNASDGIVFVSHYLKNKWEQTYKFKNLPFRYVVNPGSKILQMKLENVDCARNEINAVNRWPVLTYIGLFEYLGKVKGLCLLLEVMQELTKIYPDILLRVVGKGTHERIIKDKIDELGIQYNIEVLQNINNPIYLLKCSDLHCHITFQEGFNLSILEALSSGVPVVTNWNETEEILNVQGLIITNDEKDSIVSSIRSCLKNKPLVDTERVWDKFDWKKSTTQLNKITIGDYV